MSGFATLSTWLHLNATTTFEATHSRSARLTLTADYSTPPSPLPTAIMCRISGGFSGPTISQTMPLRVNPIAVLARCNFKLNRSGGFLPHDDRSRGNAITVADVPHPQAHQIARPQFAVQPQVKKRKLSCAVAKLQPYSDGSHIL